jgi:hypothetical protein
MASGRLDKVSMLARIFKLKQNLHHQRQFMNPREYKSADHQLNLVLDILDEYIQ